MNSRQTSKGRTKENGVADIETLNKIKDAVLKTNASGIDYWVERFKKQMKGYTQTVHGLHGYKPFMYRIRKHDPGDSTLIHKDDFSYYKHSSLFWVPKNQSGARANLPFQRRLYFASSIETAMNECGVKKGDIFTLAKIRPKDSGGWFGFKPVILGFKTYKDNYPEFYKNECEILKTNKDLGVFLSDSFIEDTDHSNYCFTQLIATVLFEIPQMKCIIYPSTKYSDKGGYNVAYCIDQAETELEYEWAKVCYCEGYNAYSEKYQYIDLQQPPFI